MGIVLAFIGLILLAGPENNLLALGVGEMITLASAVAIAAEIILISAWAGKVDVRRVTVVQLATASLVAFAAMKPAGESVPSLTPALLGVALGLGIFSAIRAQRSVSPTRATLIYTGEPVWAGIFGRLAGERLPLLALLGCVLILAGVLVSELKWKRKSPPQVSTNDDAQPLADLADRREP
ncbi:putative transmembrane protein [Klebsiella pneumoniae]|nr:putative transmembrane protein [Klebsiella pneumoniae]